jgi:hypothetical protein
MWVDNWGTTTGNVIRVGMIVAGIALWFFGHKAEKSQSSS